MKNRINTLTLFIAAILCVIGAIHVVTTLQIGYMSDDFALIENAATGKRLWHLHYSPVFQFLWECSAAGSFGQLGWHALSLGFHLLNSGITFYIARRQMQLSLNISLFALALTAMNPAGIEAVAWSCSAGYVVTSTWLLLGVSVMLSQMKTTTIALLLALLQLLAFLTWDWGILLFPIVLAILWAINIPWNRPFDIVNFMTLWAPLGACWLVGFILRSTSQYETGWQDNDLLTMVKFVIGAPFLGLFPNFDKTFYVSLPGMVLGSFVALFLVWSAFKNRFALAMLLAFILCIMPWVLGANPSSRYFYIPMPFLYLTLSMGLQQIKPAKIAPVMLSVLLAVELTFAYERAKLWYMAYKESQSLKNKVEQLVHTSAPHSFIILNIPDAYGPEQLPMRPQMWFCGFHTLFPSVDAPKSQDCPYVWKAATSYANKKEILAAYPDKKVYEVVYHQPGDWSEFDIIEHKQTESAPSGSTPLTDTKGLKIDGITSRKELNDVERKAILKAHATYFSGQRHPLEWFDEKGLQTIHRDMFSDVWEWAGIYYKGKQRNIGISPSEIPLTMNDLTKQVQEYLEGKTRLSYLEQSARILHKLTQIHPFTNGNGRFSRFVAALYLHSLHGTAPEYPEEDLVYDGEPRKEYIAAIKAADNSHFLLLEDFIVKYGGRNPSILAMMGDPFFKQNFSTRKRIESVINFTYFQSRMHGHYPTPLSVYRPLADAAILLIEKEELVQKSITR